MKCASASAFAPFTIAITTLLASVLVAGSVLAETAPMRAGDPAGNSSGQPAIPAGHPPMPTTAPAATTKTQGKVLETMDAANYTYARVETPGGEKWIAGPKTAVKVGDLIGWPSGSEMKNFASKSLNRTFESIFFVDRLEVAGTLPGGAASPHGTLSEKAAEAPDVKGIAKAKGGLTIAEIYDGRAGLEGKDVIVRGKVVKYNSAVMGRNWLHLRDGSRDGSSAGSKGSAGDNDLTVTSETGEAAVGDTVVVHGKVVLNKDFGFNYRYDLMIEGATVTVEK